MPINLGPLTPVKKKKKPVVTPRILMPSGGSGGPSGYTPPHPGRHVQPHIGSPSDPTVPPTSISRVTPSGHRVTTYPSAAPSSVPASHAVTGSRTPALSAADKQRIQAVQSLATAQKQIAKLAKSPKVKLPKPPKLQKLKSSPVQTTKLAKGLAVAAELNKTPAPVDKQLLQAQKGLHRYVATVKALPKAALPKAVKQAPVPKVKAAKPSKPKAAQKASGAKLDKTKGPYKYAYPFSKGISIGRTDMGIDPVGTGNVRAISKAKVIGTPAEGAGSGWPNEQPSAHSSGAGIVYKVLKGPLKGKKVYTYEGPSADTSFKRGDILKRGQVIGKSVADFETGLAHGAKGGFAPVAHDVYTEGMVTKAGTKFGNIVAQIKQNPAKVSGGGTTSHKIPKVTGPLNKDQKVFAGALAKESGLSPKVTAAWTLAEGGSGDGSNNWLNIGVTDTGRLGVSTAGGFSNPVSAAKLTAKFIKGQWGGASSGIQAIQSTAGKSDRKQLSTIASSGWATNPQYASLLASTYGSVGSKGTVRVSAPVSYGATGATSVSGATTSGTTSAPVSGSATTSGTTSRSTAAQNRARLLRAVNQNRKKAAAAIGSYRKGLTPTSPSAPAAPSSSSPSSGSISLGL